MYLQCTGVLGCCCSHNRTLTPTLLTRIPNPQLTSFLSQPRFLFFLLLFFLFCCRHRPGCQCPCPGCCRLWPHPAAQSRDGSFGAQPRWCGGGCRGGGGHWCWWCRNNGRGRGRGRWRRGAATPDGPLPTWQAAGLTHAVPLPHPSPTPPPPPTTTTTSPHHSAHACFPRFSVFPIVIVYCSCLERLPSPPPSLPPRQPSVLPVWRTSSPLLLRLHAFNAVHSPAWFSKRLCCPSPSL